MQSQLAAFCGVLFADDHVDLYLWEYIEHNYARFEAQLPFENENNEEKAR